ncbi:transcription factor DYT1 [Prosopis cineraria]|uniref:transcription factor DYT1 n=1 Tax=Prosopis cineraria TaxID=364024 RepID=UPI00240F16FF|nr:transcription factor DYT1 [Prosopis cineraria]
MDYAEENGFCTTFEDFCDLNNNEGGSIRRSMIRKRRYGDNDNNNNHDDEENDDGTRFKSKNLQTERKRREKLSSRLLMLRSLVPIITNMTRACIIDDAITYIKKMQTQVESLTQELQTMEAKANSQPLKTENQLKIDESEEEEEEEDMKKCGTQVEVKVTQIDVNKLWMKIIIEQRRGRVKKLIEAMNSLGIDLLDINVTTIKGAFLITTSIQENNGERIGAKETQELMLDVIRTI